MNIKPAYPEMKAFLRFFSERYLDPRFPTPADRPMAQLERSEQLSVKDAESALRMAVNNCLEISAPWPLVQITSLDTEMHAAGIPSLSQVRSQVWGRYAAMLKRGVIRSGDELVVARGVLADASLVNSLPADERAGLQAMVLAFGRERPQPPGTGPRPGPPRRPFPGRR